MYIIVSGVVMSGPASDRILEYVQSANRAYGIRQRENEEKEKGDQNER